jgi:iron complex outermembrane receptor protein
MPLFAQETAAPPQSAAPAAGNATPDMPAQASGALGEIIVTAQRRSESLQRTPVAVSVLTGDTLVKKNISTESDLQMNTPGLIVRSGQNSNALNYAIRGESLDPFSNTRPGVLPYVDEIQVSSAGGSSAFYDLQSVQVLKGPQGTLFGRNSTGGAVLFTTTKPTNDLEGYLSAHLGTYNERQFEGAVNVPVVDDAVLLRVAAISQYHDGYQVNQLDGERLGTVKRNGARVSLTLKPMDRLQNTTVFDYLKSGGSPMSSVLYSLTPTGAIPVIGLTETMPLPGYANIGAYLAAQQARGPYKPSIDGQTSFDARNILISNITSYDLGKDTQLRNIFGYGNTHQTLFSDSDGSAYQINDNDPLGKIDRIKQISEEFQIVGKALSNNLAYTAGVYYARERDFDFTTSRLLGINGPAAAIQYNTADTGSDTYAAYAQGTYQLADLTGIQGLGVTGGIRYSSERTSIHILPDDNSRLDPPNVQATYEFDQHHTYRNVSWTTGIQEQLNSSTLLYIASRHSYRNGGYNGFVKPVPGLGDVGGNRYDSEEVTDLEIGTKFQGRIADIPVRTNIALYSLWIKDAQRAASVLVGGAPAAITVNVPRSRVQGVEYDVEANLTSWLNIGGSVNYTDAKNTSDLVPIAGGDPVAFDTYPDAPKWSGTAFAEVTVPVGGDLTASLRGDLYGQTYTWFVGTGGIIPGARLPGYEIANFRIGLQDDRKGWSLSATVKNAFNKVYWVGGEAEGQLFQINTANPGNPRTFAVDARLKF